MRELLGGVQRALWVSLMVALTLTNYAFPILDLAVRKDTSVPAVYVGAR